MAVGQALLGAEKDGAHTQLLDLGAYGLPFLGRQHEAESVEAVRLFLSDLRSADGIILGSPEIHGGVSGVLKNALDLASVHEFEGKMIGLIGVAGGQFGASETLSHLRSVGRSLHAWVVPTQASVADADHAFDSEGIPVQSEVQTRLLAVGREVAHFARLHKCENHLQFVREWEHAGANHGTA
jgi:NAD(P)H-dependent FMN reductase